MSMFPSNPSNGQIINVSGQLYQWSTDSGTWNRAISNAGVFQADQLFDSGKRVVTTSTGAGNLTITANTISLSAIGPGSATVGGATSVPVITTDIYGRVVGLTSASVSSTLNVAGSTGTGSVALTNQSLTLAASTGITTVASGQTITVTNTGLISASAGTGISVSGTNPLTITNTGLISASAGTGISVSGTNPLTITNTGVTGVTGTANQVNASASTGAVTLSLPQNIHTGASPTFAGLTVNGTVGVTGAATIPQMFLNRSAGTVSGINWYSSGYTAWSTYMSPAGQANSGPTNNITAPSGTLVTSWALRNFVENSGGYGWTWESGTSSGQPSVVAEIRSSDGSFRSAGSIYAVGDVYSSYSDINLKTIVGKIKNPIELIRQIETFYYEPNAEAIKLGAKPGRRVGVSAQSVQNVQPETVGVSPLDSKYLTVQYERLVPLLIETVKQQQDQIDFLVQEIDKLKGSN